MVRRAREGSETTQLWQLAIEGHIFGRSGRAGQQQMISGGEMTIASSAFPAPACRSISFMNHLENAQVLHQLP